MLDIPAQTKVECIMQLMQAASVALTTSIIIKQKN